MYATHTAYRYVMFCYVCDHIFVLDVYTLDCMCCCVISCDRTCERCLYSEGVPTAGFYLRHAYAIRH